jgi:acetolactate synthase-1/2/3 large subunit
VIVVTGDGSIMMSIGELATIGQKKLPIRIHLLDNKGHAMCRQTQREWMGATYPSTSIAGGLSFPDFRKVADAFGVDMVIHTIDPEADVVPKVKAGHANEDAAPYLSPDELAREMLIPVWKS